MNIPDGWPTEEMIEAAKSARVTIPEGTLPGKVFRIIFEAMYAAAPTPPAQEAEPVLYQYRSHYCEEWLPCRKDQVDALRSHGGKVRALYTHPDNSELRKAAKPVIDYWFEEDASRTDEDDNKAFLELSNAYYRRPAMKEMK